MADLGAIGSSNGRVYRSTPAIASMGSARPPLAISTATPSQNLRVLRQAPINTSIGSGWPRLGRRSIRLDGLPWGQVLWANSGKSTTEGSSAPSLRLGPGCRMQFRIPVSPGARSFYSQAKQADTTAARPVLVVLANPEVGLSSDITVTAPSGTGWVTTPTASFTATALGAVIVELRNPAVDPWVAYWDNLVAL